MAFIWAPDCPALSTYRICFTLLIKGQMFSPGKRLSFHSGLWGGNMEHPVFNSPKIITCAFIQANQQKTCPCQSEMLRNVHYRGSFLEDRRWVSSPAIVPSNFRRIFSLQSSIIQAQHPTHTVHAAPADLCVAKCPRASEGRFAAFWDLPESE